MDITLYNHPCFDVNTVNRIELRKDIIISEKPSENRGETRKSESRFSLRFFTTLSRYVPCLRPKWRIFFEIFVCLFSRLFRNDQFDNVHRTKYINVTIYGHLKQYSHISVFRTSVSVSVMKKLIKKLNSVNSNIIIMKIFIV